MTQTDLIDVSQILDLIKIQIKYIQTLEDTQISRGKLEKLQSELQHIIRMHVSKHNMDTATDYLDMILNIFDTQE